MRCPKCGQATGFIEKLTRCVVFRRVDAGLQHVETLDWEPTNDTASIYRCVECGAWLSERELER
jgi:ribosomal protein S14